LAKTEYSLGTYMPKNEKSKKNCRHVAPLPLHHCAQTKHREHFERLLHVIVYMTSVVWQPRAVCHPYPIAFRTHHISANLRIESSDGWAHAPTCFLCGDGDIRESMVKYSMSIVIAVIIQRELDILDISVVDAPRIDDCGAVQRKLH